MIGTIVVISRFGTAHSMPQNLHQHQHDQLGHYDSPNPLDRAPSLLERVKSIDFSFYKLNPPALQTEHLQITEPGCETPHYPNQLVRQPSLLDRFKSINFSSYKFEQRPNPETEHLKPTEPELETHNPSPLHRQPSLLDRLKTLNFPSFYPHEQADYREAEMESNPYGDSSQSNDHLVKRCISDTRSGDSNKSQPEKIKKSVSEKAKAGNLKEDDEIVVPAYTKTTVYRKSIDRNRGRDTVLFREDEEVDAKADDFINRFKNQLKLQRIDSLKRFSEMFKGKNN